MSHQLLEISVDDELVVYHKGPPKGAGPLPSIFYFALTGFESLSLFPYNQPVEFFSSANIRFFSLTLPEHERDISHATSIGRWAKKLQTGKDVITPFISQCIKALHFLILNDWIDSDCVASAGLSRGAFIATHFAAAEPLIKKVVGYSPLISLNNLEEFNGEAPDMAKQLSTMHLIPKLVGSSFCYYIGNHDTRVGTEQAFIFLKKFTELSIEAGERSPQIELHIYPSIGHKGHGTPPHIFIKGAERLQELLHQH